MKKLHLKKENFGKKNLENELRKIVLDNEELLVVNRKPNQESQLFENNKSEIFIDFSDSEEEVVENRENTSRNAESLDFEQTEPSGGSVVECDLEEVLSNFDEKVNQSQLNMNARIENIYWENKEAVKTGKESSLYCLYQNKYQFQLTFWATNVQMKFIRNAERRITNEFGEKFSQPKSIYRFQTYIDLHSTKRTLTRKNYILVDDKNYVWKTTSSDMSTPVFTKPKSCKSFNTISKIKKPFIKNRLYLKYHEVTFVSYPKTMFIESMKPIGDIEVKSNGDLGESGTKNRGTILLKYKHDLILFTFDMLNITFEQIWLKTSRATQYADMFTYIKYFSLPCSKVLHCSLPLSTYKYKDPFKKTNYERRQKSIYGIPPNWMKEERKKRLKRFCRLKEMSESRKFELNYGSTIIFQTPYGSFCKIKCKIETGVLVEGDYHYERMAMNFQRHQTQIKKKEKEFLFMTEIKHPDMEILDNNLSFYDL